ncbi:MAG: ABC transporter substrate-binding protein [Candidatus Peregrinibacteria bacterium]|nr:ABC transporter substrate-binding protein [Candidatus Peregrinibacteria bacterium]MDZ4245356.1 ABC transporter substrate-binding protein [Candidatus Gracilibacteria bacterium]
MKSKLEYMSHKTSQGIFVGFLSLFVFIVVTVGVNFFTQGAVLEYLAKFDKNSVAIDTNLKSFSVGMAAPVTSLDPLNFEFQNRLILNNSYEGLVALDSSLQVKQALAVTFGQVDETTWEFRIREGVKFHNGSELSANDVIQSFRSAMEDSSSQLKSILANIDDITAGGGKIQIKTKKPDPTFINKLATVYIYKDFDNGERYGTGPYVLSQEKKPSNTFDGSRVLLERFDDYWGREPSVSEATFVYVQNKDERMKLFKDGKIDVLRNVPYNLLESIKKMDAVIMEQPSLEVTFLGFGFKSTEVFKDPSVVNMIIKSINRDELINAFGSAVHTANQFVSNGVVGYVPGLTSEDIEEEIPANFTLPENTDLTLDFANGQNEIAKRIQSNMKKLGFNITLNQVGGEEFINMLHSGKSDMYLLGWKSEFGDAIDFYKVMAHSREGHLGEFNAGNYSNPEVDELIAESDNTWNPLERVKILQKIMKIILIDNPLGMPILETEIIYAVKKGINFVPRIDGYIYLNELR